MLAFPARPATQGAKCNYGYKGRDNTVTYVGGEKYLGDWPANLGAAFYETLAGMGYSLAGDPKDLFGQLRGAKSAEYMVAGRVVKMSGNICREFSWWDSRPLDSYSGEISLTVEWSVLNTLTKDIVVKERSEGYFRLNEPKKSGVSIVFEKAFADAAKAFGARSDLRGLATGRVLAASGGAPASTYLIARGLPPARFDIDKLEALVVTLRVGLGHGSGFFIGYDGYLLTNAHVVGEAKSVQIVTAQGLEIIGEVIETDTARDVALVKSALRIPDPIYVQTVQPRISETVYAVGTPIDESLRMTVTKGIVSAIRNDRASGLSFIQSDTSISPGNSGGPLLNSRGEVIGISVLKVTDPQAAGLGLFIPISDALNKLGFVIE